MAVIHTFFMRSMTSFPFFDFFPGVLPIYCSLRFLFFLEAILELLLIPPFVLLSSPPLPSSCGLYADSLIFALVDELNPVFFRLPEVAVGVAVVWGFSKQFAQFLFTDYTTILKKYFLKGFFTIICIISKPKF